MNNPYKVSESKATVTVVDIVPGEAPGLRVVYRTVGANNVVRPITRQIPVPDSGLFARIQAELHEGDSIEITAINEWYEDGYDTRLAEFKKAPESEPEVVIRNGMNNWVQSEIKQRENPSVQGTREKARK